MNVKMYEIELDFLCSGELKERAIADYGDDWPWLICTAKDTNWVLLKERIVNFLVEVDGKVIDGNFDNITIPDWLSQCLGSEPTEQEAKAFMDTFFSTPVPTRYELVAPWGKWAPSEFMYWLTPEMRQFLIREFVGGADCEIRIAVEGLPAALDAFEFLVAAAADVDVEKVCVHSI